MQVSQSILVSFFCLITVFFVLGVLYVIIRAFSYLVGILLGQQSASAKHNTPLPPK